MCIIVGYFVVKFQKCSRPTEIGTVPMPDVDSNPADWKGIEALWIPRPDRAQQCD